MYPTLSHKARLSFVAGEVTTCNVDSWTTCEELANQAVQSHGVENSGWTVTLWNQLENSDAIVTETNGFDYVLDLVSEMELAPAFPAAKHLFLEQRKNSFPPIKKREVSIVAIIIKFAATKGDLFLFLPFYFLRQLARGG